MELLASSAAGSFHTIIISTTTDQALRAFEYGVIDFVPKPFSRDRLGQALQRLDPKPRRRDGNKAPRHSKAGGMGSGRSWFIHPKRRGVLWLLRVAAAAARNRRVAGAAQTRRLLNVEHTQGDFDGSERSNRSR